MRLTYIRKAEMHLLSQYDSNTYFCANCQLTACVLLQNAEFLYLSKILFLIRRATSGLTVILPNMDRMAGGELE